MKDVSDQVMSLQLIPSLPPEKQPVPLFQRDQDSKLQANPNLLLPWGDLLKFGWRIFDWKKLDGLTLAKVDYTTGGINAEQKAIAAGRVFALDRETAKTRLFFVWMPTLVARGLAAGNLPRPINFHVLYHPPAYHDHYLRTPYWNGRHPKEAGSQHSETAMYVELGIRYLCQDFFSVAHHVMATAARDPYLIYVVPVSDNSNNFSDLVTPGGIQSALTEIYSFLSRTMSGKEPPQFDVIGKVMLSGYSRSGDRLAALMSSVAPGNRFFRDHLYQLNAFDINLADKEEARLQRFTDFWSNVRRWKSDVNPSARAFIYTNYRSHFQLCKNQPPSNVRWTLVEDFNLETPTWTDEALKALSGSIREQASEYYTDDASWGVVCLPLMFFQYYLSEGNNEIGNKTRGWRKWGYQSGGMHGHGLFLRGMMSHAINHADPVFYAGPATRK